MLLIVEGKPSKAFVDFARQLDLIVADTPVDCVDTYLSTHWRVRNQEGVITGPAPTPRQLELLRGLGITECVSVRRESDRRFDGAIIPGGFTHEVARRLVHLTCEASAGAVVPKVYLLGSDRPLAKHEIEHLRQQGIEAQIEARMVERLYRKTACEAWPAVVVRSDAVIVRDGLRPASIRELVEQWLVETGIRSGRYLFVSSQPLLKSDLLAARRIVPDTIEFVGVAPAVPANEPLAFFMDGIARWFHEELDL